MIASYKARCPITYEELLENEELYSQSGLRKLSPTLKNLLPLPYTMDQQRYESTIRSPKFSIAGVQSKLSATLDVKAESFCLVNTNGRFILKPQHLLYPFLPENEDLSMRLAQSIIAVPLHGLVYSLDGKLKYFVKRFDRPRHGLKIPVEDFSQLAGQPRIDKYNFSMEKMVKIIDKFCTFPAVEKYKFFHRVLFNFLIGNEDMHLKNYSLWTENNKIAMAPAYDFINTTLAIGKAAKEQISLPLNGKKSNLTQRDLCQYFGIQCLGLPEKAIAKTLETFSNAIPKWNVLINNSFLPPELKEGYLEIVRKRAQVLLSNQM